MLGPVLGEIGRFSALGDVGGALRAHVELSFGLCPLGFILWGMGVECVFCFLVGLVNSALE